jgi:YidC/Oxa1 family membrane protein insertase
MNEEVPNSQRNILIFLVACAVLFAVGQQFLPAPAPAPANQAAAAAGGTGAAAAAPAAPAAPAMAPGASAASVAQPAVLTTPQLMTTDSTTYTFTNLGGRVSKIALTKPAQWATDETGIGVFPSGASKTLSEGLLIPSIPELKEDSVYELVNSLSQSNGSGFDRLVYRWNSPDGRWQVVKKFEPDARAFGLKLEVEVVNRTATEQKLSSVDVVVAGLESESGGSFMGSDAAVVEGLCVGQEETERSAAKGLDETISLASKVSFGGLDEQYFLHSVAATTESGAAAELSRCSFGPTTDGVLKSTVSTGPLTVAANGIARAHFSVYAGPKTEQFLGAYPHGLKGSINLGWFSFLAVPIRWTLVFFHGWVNNWGLAIILLTIAIKVLLYMPTAKSMRSMEKLREIQPKIAELQKLYANDQMKLAEAQMKLFKDAGTSPFGGCLPTLLQMPIYIALYRTVWGSAELYRADFMFWVTDLSKRDPYFALPVLMGVMMFAQARLTPQAVDNPQMKVMQNVMPFLFTAMMLFLPSGLVLYIVVNTVLSIAQQMWIKREMEIEKTSLSKS